MKYKADVFVTYALIIVFAAEWANGQVKTLQ